MAGKEDAGIEAVGAAGVDERLPIRLAARIRAAADEYESRLGESLRHDARRGQEMIVTFEIDAARYRRSLRAAHRRIKVRDQPDQRNLGCNAELAAEGG